MKQQSTGDRYYDLVIANTTKIHEDNTDQLLMDSEMNQTRVMATRDNQPHSETNNN